MTTPLTQHLVRPPLRHAPVLSFLSGAARFLAVALLLSGALRSAAAPDEPRRASPDAEIVELPEFSVSTTADEWVATQAMSGTRTAAPQIELPYGIQVLTEEFITDFQLVGLTNQMTFFTGFSGGSDLADPAIGGSSQTGNMLRGFPVTIIRDGFSSNGTAAPPTIANTAQVEVVKGPLSTLYGDAQPGGLVNYVTKRPTLQPRFTIDLGAGSYGYARGSVTASGPLSAAHRLYYLLVTDNLYRRSAMQYTYARTGDYLASLLWKPTRDTSLKVTFEAVRLTGARAASLPFLVVGTKVSANQLTWSGGTIVGVDWRLARIGYSRFGPNERYTRNYDGVNVLFEHAFNSVWKQRVGYQGSWKSFNLRYRTNSNVSAETNRMSGVQPNRRIQGITAPTALNADLLGKFRLGAARHELLFNGDYSYIKTRDRQMRIPTAAVASLPDSYRYQDPFNPDWSVDIDDTQLTRVGSKGFENLRSVGGGASERLFLAGERLILMGNLRYNKSYFAEDTNTAADAFVRGSDDAVTNSAGLNYKVSGDNRLVAFANVSRSFNNNPTVDRNTGTTIPNERGKGLEGGLKSLTADQRFGLTLSFYRIEKSNIGQDNPEFVLGNGLPEYLGSGLERVRGSEADANWQPFRNFTVTAGASYLDAKVVASTNATLLGQRKIYVPRMTGSLAAQYKCDGRLRGLRFGGGFRYTGSFVRAYATATRLYERSSPRQIADAFVRYSWKRSRLNHSVGLNVNNLFDEFYVGPDLGVGMGRQVNLKYSLDFR